MKAFIKQVFSNLVALFIFSILTVFGSILFFFLFQQIDEVKTVKPNTFLEIPLSGEVVPYSKSNPSFTGIVSNSGRPEISLIKLEKVLKKAAQDDNITGIFIKPSSIFCSGADLEAILHLLNNFTETSEKPLICYTENALSVQAAIGATSTHHLHASYGYYKLRGCSIQSIFYKDLFEEHGIEAYVFRSGKDKSAMDPYLFNKFPKRTRKRIKNILLEQEDQFRESIIKGFQKKRKNTTAKEWSTLLHALQNRIDPFTAKQALEAKLIDGTVNSIKDAENWIMDEYQSHFINYDQYSSTLTSNDSLKGKAPTACVIHLAGKLSPGKSKKGQIGHQTVIEKLETLPSTCDKVFLILDTPGGCSFTTEAIVAKMNELKAKKNIQFIGIMQGTCASGGFYLSGACDEVLAYKSTITGSLGVYALILNIHQLLERYNIHVDTIQSHDRSRASLYGFDASEGFTDEEFDEIQEGVMDTEKRFKEKMTRNGKIPIDKVSQYAGGIAFLAPTGVEAGFIDELIEDSLLETLHKKAPEHRFLFLSPYEEEFDFSNIIGGPFSNELAHALSLLNANDPLLRAQALQSLRKHQGTHMKIDFEILLEGDITPGYY